MKIVIFSDSHGDVETMCNVVVSEQPDTIIHLGDHVKDADKLKERYPNIQFFKVLGNTDSKNEDEEWIQYIEICGKRFMLTHGHTFIDEAATFRQGEQKMFIDSGDVNIILYGHTHEPFINCCNGKWIMNPGRIGRKHDGTNIPVYGVLKIDEFGVFKWYFIEVGV
jgi:putative phosphoesterase